MSLLSFSSVGITALAACVPRHVINNYKYDLDIWSEDEVRQVVNKVGVFKSGIMVRLKRNTVRLPFTTYGIDWALNKKDIQPKKEVETE